MTRNGRLKLMSLLLSILLWLVLHYNNRSARQARAVQRVRPAPTAAQAPAPVAGVVP
jgi:hypothetical protein